MPLYSDVNSLSPTKKPMLYDSEAIAQSLYNLVSIRRTQRLFRNDIYIDFEDELFEIIDDITSLEILRLIGQRIELYEPRVILDYSRSSVIPYPDENKYEVRLIYNIVGQDEQQFEFTGVVSK